MLFKQMRRNEKLKILYLIINLIYKKNFELIERMKGKEQNIWGNKSIYTYIDEIIFLTPSKNNEKNFLNWSFIISLWYLT